MSINLSRMNAGDPVWSFGDVPGLNSGTVKLVLNTSKTSIANPIAESASVNLQDISTDSFSYIDFAFSNVSMMPNTEYFVHYVFSNPTTAALKVKSNGSNDVKNGWVVLSSGQTGEYQGTAARVYVVA